MPKDRVLVKCDGCGFMFDHDDIVPTESPENYCMGCFIDLEYPENV